MHKSKKQKVKKKYVRAFVTVVILFWIISENNIFTCCAVSSENFDEAYGNYDCKEDYRSFIESLPEDILQFLPEGTYDVLDSPEKVTELFKAEYILNISSGLLRNALSASLKTFALVASVTLIMAVLSAVGKAFSSDGAGIKVWNLAGTLCIGFSAYSLVWSHTESVMNFAENISAFIKSLAVVIGGVYLSAGEVGSAGIHNVWVFSITSVTEELCGKLLLPIMQISFSATLMSGIVSGVNISRLVQMIRNIFTSLLVFLMTVISVILSFQTIIAHSSDTVAMRSIKYAISHSVPVIGGLVSDSARTLATGFTLMKNSIGFVGIVIIILISLGPLITLVASKYALQLASAFSSVISEDMANTFLDESVKMLNFLIAIVIMLSVVFMFCIAIFAILPASGT
ncbi:MAG: hypothetical protein E7633_02880 [Ruminococcaceae bacterium]|nr:hypothetical protein [Oscillospiraceae bacterium]